MDVFSSVRALGMVQHLPIDDKVSMTIAEVRAQLSIALAGRAAEEIFFGADKKPVAKKASTKKPAAKNTSAKKKAASNDAVFISENHK